MSHYLHGIDCVGDAGTGGAPSLPLDPGEFGPASGGTYYTDVPTIKAVQQALIAKGFSVGKDGADGKFGPDTEAALFAFGGVHGPPDGAMLARLGVVPVPLTKKPSISTPSIYAQPQAPARGGVVASVDQGFWMQPLWTGAPVRRWQGAIGGVGAFAILLGLTVAVVRR
jgi:hypothetical protein